MCLLSLPPYQISSFVQLNDPHNRFIVLSEHITTEHVLPTGQSPVNTTHYSTEVHNGAVRGSRSTINVNSNVESLAPMELCNLAAE